MIDEDQIIGIELVDDWPDEVARLVGLIGIAFAQLTREVYLAAKRKVGKGIVEWETDHPNDNLQKWCSHLRSEYPDDKELNRLVSRVECAAAGRHDLFHATWGKHPSGHLVRVRRRRDTGIHTGQLADLLAEIRAVRNGINKHTLSA